MRTDEVSSGVTRRGGTLLERFVGEDHGYSGGEVGSGQDNNAVIERTGR